MTGIEKIVSKIEQDCNVICGDIISRAQAESQAILKNAQIEAEKIKSEAFETAKNKIKINIELSNSKAEHEYKKEILATKISIINEIIDESIHRLKNLPDSDYFNVITMLIKRYAQDGCGSLRFSRKDLNRLPQGFEESLNEMFAGSGKSFVISSESLNIDGGVVIVYKEVEQNCTFDSLLNASIDEIKDELFEEIFMRDSI